ncbi:hypothetical protein PIB30_083436 [Stylosanthes scabra]|uniref:Uncharacterized protein n=1 Tax=Stylosanthes scabra TaxID=79078 RepID=A0ABU6RSG0_9FABA|nr:hypothetical protein [Stylosanthes scabra]
MQEPPLGADQMQYWAIRGCKNIAAMREFLGKFSTTPRHPNPRLGVAQALALNPRQPKQIDPHAYASIPTHMRASLLPTHPCPYTNLLAPRICVPPSCQPTLAPQPNPNTWTPRRA